MVATRAPGSGGATDPVRLICRIREGAEQELGTLLHLYRHYLNVLASSNLDRKLQARVSPSDVVQETMLEAHRDFHQFRGESEREFAAWLRQILVHNLARTIDRHVKAEKRDVRRDISLARLKCSVDRSTMHLGQAFMADWQETPSAAAQRRERAVILADILSELTPAHREVLILRNLKGLKFREVAQQLGRSEPATKMLWMRAIKRLRARFLEHDRRDDDHRANEGFGTPDGTLAEEGDREGS